MMQAPHAWIPCRAIPSLKNPKRSGQHAAQNLRGAPQLLIASKTIRTYPQPLPARIAEISLPLKPLRDLHRIFQTDRKKRPVPLIPANTFSVTPASAR